MVRKWTPEERAAQAALIRQQKPWEHTTGPKTAEGKKASSRNALKHGLTSAESHVFTGALRETRDLLRLLKKLDRADED